MEKTTREAFNEMIHTRGIHHQLGLKQNQVGVFRAMLKEGKKISLDKMEELLEKAGWTVVQEKLWSK